MVAFFTLPCLADITSISAALHIYYSTESSYCACKPTYFWEESGSPVALLHMNCVTLAQDPIVGVIEIIRTIQDESHTLHGCFKISDH